MIDTFYKFKNQAEMLEVLSNNNMTYSSEEQVRDEQGNLVYTIESQPIPDQFDIDGNPIMQEVQTPVMEQVIKPKLGGHEYAAWEVGIILGITKTETIDGVDTIVPDDSYHYNLRLVDENFDISSLEPYLVYPKASRVTWA